MSDTQKLGKLGEAFVMASADCVSLAAELYTATKREDMARSERIRALNAFNEASKKFDALVVEIRKAAPRDTDWNSPKGHRVATDE